MVDDAKNVENDKDSADAPSEEILEPTMGKGLPSYRPWDWLAGYLLAILITLLMFGLSERMYDIG